MGLFDGLRKVAVELPISDVLQQRLAFCGEQLADAKAEIVLLTSKLAISEEKVLLLESEKDQLALRHNEKCKECDALRELILKQSQPTQTIESLHVPSPVVERLRGHVFPVR